MLANEVKLESSISCKRKKLFSLGLARVAFVTVFVLCFVIVVLFFVVAWLVFGVADFVVDFALESDLESALDSGALAWLCAVALGAEIWLWFGALVAVDSSLDSALESISKSCADSAWFFGVESWLSIESISFIDSALLADFWLFVDSAKFCARFWRKVFRLDSGRLDSSKLESEKTADSDTSITLDSSITHIIATYTTRHIYPTFRLSVVARPRVTYAASSLRSPIFLNSA